MAALAKVIFLFAGWAYYHQNIIYVIYLTLYFNKELRDRYSATCRHAGRVGGMFFSECLQVPGCTNKVGA